MFICRLKCFIYLRATRRSSTECGIQVANRKTISRDRCAQRAIFITKYKLILYFTNISQDLCLVELYIVARILKTAMSS